MSDTGFWKQILDAGGNIQKLEELEKEKMKQYQQSPTTTADFQATFVGFAVEQQRMKEDKEKKKNLCLAKKTGQIIILGLENAGKTTLLNTIKDDPLARYTSALYPTSEELIMGNIKFTAFDLSGNHAQAGGVWKDYFPVVDSIIFLVDATDRRRFAEAKAELDTLLTDEQIANAPIAILGTKCDLPTAVNDERLGNFLGLSSITNTGAADQRNTNNRKVKLFMCSTNQQATFGQAFRWLGLFLKDI